MSNVANKLANIGMIEEAMSKCEKALKTENYHKNVTDVISRIKEIPQEEEKQQTELIEKSKTKREFYKLLGRAIAAVQPISLVEQWVGPDCPLNLHLSNGDVRLVGIYESKSNPFAGLVATPPAFMKLKTKLRVEYLLTLRGRTLDGTVKRTTADKSSTATTGLLGLGDSDLKVLIVLNDNQTEMSVMENPRGASPRFYSIKQSATKAEARLAQS